ncbi:MAG: 4Fe-4S ferredoxin [Leptolyngbyaceae cyanobacterium SL_7_1]|nr:4Fe-4S ferredoxin [Leptolyngbyaceae cyanobacterium SL_7_1]
MTDLHRPLHSLKQGSWFKLICGASFQHLPAVRNLTLAYTLAGADCIDVAADPAVIAAAREGLAMAEALATVFPYRRRLEELPYLMVSLNDGEDPHFRKAAFDATQCPADCLRPCEAICPAQAIVFAQSAQKFSGVLEHQCYGCGRCLPVCPVQQISTRSYVSSPTAIASLVLQGVDAVEIHTQVGRIDDFTRLWNAIVPYLSTLKVVAISCPDGEDLISYLRALYRLITPLPCPVIWQTDGRPMSGDIGDGATRAAVKLGQKVLAANLPGYVQLAGGTNSHTVSKLRALGLLNQGEAPISPQQVAGVAYGSYARGLLSPILKELEQRAMNCSAPASQLKEVLEGDITARSPIYLESVPDLLQQAVILASSLVCQLKPLSNSMKPNPVFVD